MRTRQLLNLEYSFIPDADKLIGISKHLDVYDGVREMVYKIIEYHQTMRQHMGVEIIPVLILNVHVFMANVIPMKELETIKYDYEYVVNAFDMLKHYSH